MPESDDAQSPKGDNPYSSSKRLSGNQSDQSEKPERKTPPAPSDAKPQSETKPDTWQRRDNDGDREDRGDRRDRSDRDDRRQDRPYNKRRDDNRGPRRDDRRDDRRGPRRDDRRGPRRDDRGDRRGPRRDDDRRGGGRFDRDRRRDDRGDRRGPRRDDDRRGGGRFDRDRRDDRGDRRGPRRDDDRRGGGRFGDDRRRDDRPFRPARFSEDVTGTTDPDQPDRRGLADDEQKLCGWNACLAVFTKRPTSIVRAYVHQDREEDAAELLKFMGQKKLAFHLVGEDDLQRVTQSSHHEGICLVVRHQQMTMGFETWCKKAEKLKGHMPVLLLENIANPHNLGAILRVAAHFGAQAVLVAGECGQGEDPNLVRLPAATFRTAEGGAESIPLIRLRKPVEALERLKIAGFAVIATSSHASESLYDLELRAKTVFLLGSERDGLSKELLEQASTQAAIPGTGDVESLNVACASSVLMAEFRRQFPVS